MIKKFIFILCLLVFAFSAFLIICRDKHNSDIVNVSLSELFTDTQNNIKIVDEYTEKLVKENSSKSRTYDSLDFTWEREGSSTNWSYYNGFLMLALLKTGKYTDFVDSYYNDLILEDGTLNNKNKKYTRYIRNDVDYYPQVRTLLYLSKSKYFYKYKLLVDKMYFELMNHETLSKCGNNFHHRNRWKEFPFGLDGLYMALPFMLEYQLNANDLNLLHKQQNIEAEIYSRMKWVSKKLRNKNGLYYHAIKSNGISSNGVVWLRAVGWYAMAQVELINDMKNTVYFSDMKTDLINFFDALIKVQDKETGLWKNNLYNKFYIKKSKRKLCNNFETSGTAMIAYAMLYAYNNGFIDDDKYLISALNAFNGIIKYNMTRNEKGYNFINIYQGTGVGSTPETYEICSGYLTNEAKGIAPIILLSEEARKTVNQYNNK